MRVAIVHYHLQRGGVTRVIANALSALQPAPGEAVVLSSTPSKEPLPCPVALVPELAYRNEATPDAGKELAAALMEAARAKLDARPDVWHFHNHSLGKNVAMPEAVQHLVADGARVVLQIHDFAEDGRPANYERQRHACETESFPGSFHDKLYPSGKGIRYAVLNKRDGAVLRSAGLPEARLVHLPNPVSLPPEAAEADEDPGVCGQRPLILYPTRAIRRKNIGELLLLARVYPEFRFATTLSPQNPEWLPVYKEWTRLASALKLDVGFALGESTASTFPQLVRSARAMVTTSVGEGFGLAFLEPWLFGKPVCGRDLPDITADFAANGLRMPACYKEWRVSVSAFDLPALRRRFIDSLRALHTAYDRPLAPDHAEAAFARITAGGSVDFAQLDETAQGEVLRQPLPSVFPDPLPRRPFTPESLEAPVLDTNRRHIEDAYGLPAYRQRLRRLYHDLLHESPEPGPALDPEALLDAFLAPENLRLLRT